MGKVRDFIILIASVVAITNAQQAPTSGGHCKKNILIIVDTSISIGPENFNKHIKPFLKTFASNKTLNIGRSDGAQVALLLFSNWTDPESKDYMVKDDKTKLVIPFDWNYDAEQFVRYIDTNMTWENIKGGLTRTDKALEIANDVFPDVHLNDRSNVIVLITDGEPTGPDSNERDSLDYAEKLKKKGVFIIGIGVGGNIWNNKFWNFLESVSTPGHANRKEFDKFQAIRNHLVTTSCKKQVISPGLDCTCPDIRSAPYDLKQGETSRTISWKKPVPVCSPESDKIFPFTWDPPYNSPATFEAGVHSIKYTFNLTANQKLNCTVTIEVKGPENLCRGKTYSVGQEVCCCGVVHHKKDNHECCGTDYFSKATKRCCPGSTLRDINQDCSGRSCKCPEMNLGTRYMKARDLRTSVTWTVPHPSCGGNLVTITPSVRPGQSFAPGVYKVDYLYKTPNQFDVKCTLRFEVKKCGCTSTGSRIHQVHPGETSIPVTWVVPQPTCSGAITNTVLPEAKSGQAFSIGQHTVVYKYTINNQFELTCSVNFEVRGALCLDKGYNPATQICCCGTIYDIRPDHSCCQQSYYLQTTHHCCGNAVVRANGVPCPKQKRK